jgi:hypothetical protein
MTETQTKRAYKEAKLERIKHMGGVVIVRIPGASNYLGDEARLEIRVKGSSDMPIYLSGSNIASQQPVFINLERKSIVALRDACNEWLENERKGMQEAIESLGKKLRR